jgi:hypothetical protein
MLATLAVSLLIGLQAVEPLSRAHAHNDYLHARPLLDALDNGFCSVEADIFLVDGELRVGHELSQTKPGVTLQKLYLDPLLERVRANKGSVYPTKAPFMLLVDVKADGMKVVEQLAKVLPAYKEMLTSGLPYASEGAELGEKLTGKPLKERALSAVTIVISGDRPAISYGYYDGRLDDIALATLAPKQGMLLVSDNFENHFKWRGEGEMPERERTKLHWLVQKARLNKVPIRFWSIPDTPAGWREMMNAGVDYINTDKLTEFREFMDRYRKTAKSSPE